MSLQLAADPTKVMGRRVVAFLIDGVLISLVVGLLFFMMATRVHDAGKAYCNFLAAEDATKECIQLGDVAYVLEEDDALLLNVVAIGLAFVALVVLTATTGASPGKLVVGLRVVDAQGRRCSFGRALGRWAVLVVDQGCCFVGFFVAAFTHPHRRLGDMAAGTYVVAKSSVGRPVGTPAVVPPPVYAPQSGGWQPPPGPPN